MGLVTRRFLRDQLEPFATAFGRRPGGANRGGASFFHYFGLWCAIKLLRPLHIIESGCHNGVGSWFLRQAAGPYVNITFISPQWPRVFVDRQPGTRHLFGSAFRDFGDVPWEVWLPAHARASTLIFFDDHQAGLRRSVEAARFGFQHAVFDDNYLPGLGDNFALKTFNAAARPVRHPRWADNFGRPTPKAWYRNRQLLNTSDLAALHRVYETHVAEYYEFPPVWAGPNRFGVPDATWSKLTKPALLREDEARAFAAKHGLDEQAEPRRYTHIAYARLRWDGAY